MGMPRAITMRAFALAGVLFFGHALNGVVGDGSRHPTGFRRGLLVGRARNVRGAVYPQKPLAEAMGMPRAITIQIGRAHV